MDLELLSLLRHRDNYTRFKPYIQEHTLSPETKQIINVIDFFFRSYPSDEISWDAFRATFQAMRSAQIPKDDWPNYHTIFDKLVEFKPSVVTDDVLRHYITTDYAHRVTDLSMKVREGRASFDEIAELVKQHDKEMGRALDLSDLFVTSGAAGTKEMEPGLEWRLGELNVSLGPLRRGDHVAIAAYVETGKTTLISSEVSYLAAQLPPGKQVVWVNNEERSEKVYRRIVQAGLGITLKEYFADSLKAERDFDKLMGMEKRILVMANDSALCNKDRLTAMFRDINPGLLVFDVLDKVEGFRHREEGEHMRLGKVWKWARDLSHEHCPVISVTQCDGSAEGEQYITMNQLRGSKVDKPAECDAIVTVGKSNDPKRQNDRFLHVPKNKLDGGPRSEEAHRHGYWEVQIKPEIARYVGTR